MLVLADKSGIPSVRLQSVTKIGRRIFLNDRPKYEWLLPLTNEFKVWELRDEILRACAFYDVSASTNEARILAVSIARQIIESTFNGEFFSLD